MPTLDSLMVRSRKPDMASFLADELYRLGYRSDKPQALLAFAKEGRGGKEEERAVTDAVADYQRTWKADLDALAGRSIMVDGDPGPITLQHLLTRTCPVPDRQYASDGTLIPMDAKWPDGCVADVGFYLDWSTFNASAMGCSREEFLLGFEQGLAEIKRYAKLGFRVTEDRAAARMYVRFERLGGSTLAWSHLANNDCGDKEQRYTTGYWTNAKRRFLVPLHECLHAAGCPHTPGNYVMNPSIIESLDGMTERDVQNLMSQGYAKADPKPEPPPEDPADPTPRGFACRVTKKDGTVILAPEIAELSFKLKAT